MSEIGIFSRPGTLDSEIPQILQCLHEAGFALVIMTMGERGAAAFDGQEVFRQSALAVEVIDTLGVGDAFIGSFLSRFVKNASIPSALKHAAEYGAFLHDRRCFLIIDMNPDMALINLLFPPI